MKKVAISACLMGKSCRYDATDNHNEKLMTELKNIELISFCPEDFAFGTPRPTMDLVQTKKGVCAVSNATGEDLSVAVQNYAKLFFRTHANIDLVIGKDRSPSCGVCSARVYDEEKNLLASDGVGLMIEEAKKQNIPCVDAEKFIGLS